MPERAGWHWRGLPITSVRFTTRLSAVTGTPPADFNAGTRPVPEPENYALTLAGPASMGAVARRRKAA